MNRAEIERNAKKKENISVIPNTTNFERRELGKNIKLQCTQCKGIFTREGKDLKSVLSPEQLEELLETKGPDIGHGVSSHWALCPTGCDWSKGRVRLYKSIKTEMKTWQKPNWT